MDSDLRELSPTGRYEQRIAHFLEEVKRLEARSRGYSNLRLAIVVIGIITVIIGPKETPFWILLLTALILLLLVLFIAAAIRHQLIEERLETGRELVRRNQEGKARIARNWKDLPDRSPPAELVSSLLAQDLDLFGSASLFDLICTANTWEGRNAVARALLSGIEPETHAARQAAIRELAPKLEFRQLLECATLPLRKSAVPGNTLFIPLRGDSTLLQQRIKRWFCLVSPVALIALIGLNLIGLPRWPFGLLLTLNCAVSFWAGRKVMKDLKSATSADKAIAPYLQAFRYLVAESLSSPELAGIKTLGQEAFSKMRRLESLVSLSRLPYSPVPGLGICLNLLFLWNLNLAIAFEAQSRNAVALMKHIGLELEE